MPSTDTLSCQHMLGCKIDVCHTHVDTLRSDKLLNSEIFYEHERMKYHSHLKCCQMRQGFSQRRLNNFCVKRVLSVVGTIEIASDEILIDEGTT